MGVRRSEHKLVSGWPGRAWYEQAKWRHRCVVSRARGTSLYAAAKTFRIPRDERAETLMSRYVIRPDVVRRLAQEKVVIANEHQLVAPTLLRSQLLSLLYQAVRQGEITKEEADKQLSYMRGLQIRLLGDRTLQARSSRSR